MKLRSRITAAVLAGIMISVAVAGCANPEKAGVKALENGEYAEAEEQFQQMAESTDREESADGYNGLGMTYYEQKDYQAALEAFQQSLDQGGRQTVELYHLMGTCAMQTEDYGAALEYIRSGIALAQSASGEYEKDEETVRELKYNEIICLEQQAEWEKASAQAEAYLEAYPDDENVRKEAEFLKTR